MAEPSTLTTITHFIRYVTPILTVAAWAAVVLLLAYIAHDTYRSWKDE